MATTTNYGWTTPNDTDLVKDGASAIRTLGSSIDTTVFNNANAAIAKTIVDAKGDIIAATAADTLTRLAVGANNTVLTADSSTATGLKWATPASGGMTSIASGSLSGASVSLTSIVGTYKDLKLVIRDYYFDTGAQFRLRLNNITTSIYANGLIDFDYSNATYGFNAQFPTSFFRLSSGTSVNTTDQNNFCVVDLIDYANTATFKVGLVNARWQTTAPAEYGTFNTISFANTGAIDRIDIYPASGNFSGGTYILYGVS